MVDSGKYFHTFSDVIPIHVGNFPFSVSLIHVAFSGNICINENTGSGLIFS